VTPTPQMLMSPHYNRLPFYQLGGGTYLRAAPIWLYDFEDDDYSVPLGVSIGRIFKKVKLCITHSSNPSFRLPVKDQDGQSGKYTLASTCNSLIKLLDKILLRQASTSLNLY
jgi:hypothetical protein